MNNIMIQYQGFQPCEWTRSYLDSKLHQLYTRAPEGSQLRAVITRKRKIFTASVRILSAAGHFFASAQGPNPRDVQRKLNEQLRKQLKRWKTIHVRHRRLRDLKIEDWAAAGDSYDSSVA